MKEYRKIPSLKFLYEINQDGVIRNVKSKKILKPRATPNSEYLNLHTTIKGKSIDIGIHRLVAECWVEVPERHKGKPLSELEVNHKDFNVKNNNYKNLEWMTPYENIHYSIDAGHFNYVHKGNKYWLGKNLPDDTRNKISNKLVEYYKNNEHPMLGKKHSEESKEKMKASHSDFNGCKHPRAIKDKVKMISLDNDEKVFNNLDEASEYIASLRNIDIHTARQSIVRVCTKRRKVAYRAHWYFI